MPRPTDVIMAKSIYDDNEIVFGVRESRKTDTFFKKISAKFYYSVINLYYLNNNKFIKNIPVLPTISKTTPREFTTILIANDERAIPYVKI